MTRRPQTRRSTLRRWRTPVAPPRRLHLWWRRTLGAVFDAPSWSAADRCLNTAATQESHSLPLSLRSCPEKARVNRLWKTATSACICPHVYSPAGPSVALWGSLIPGGAGGWSYAQTYSSGPKSNPMPDASPSGWASRWRGTGGQRPRKKERVCRGACPSNGSLFVGSSPWVTQWVFSR